MTFNYVGPVNTTGYGVASIGYLGELLKLDNTIGFKPIGQIQGQPPIEGGAIDQATKNFDPSKPTFCFWHLSDIPNQIEECTGRKVGMTTFEVGSLKVNEIEALTKLDTMCTASTWGKEVLEKYYTKGVHVIPHAFKFSEVASLPAYDVNQDSIPVWEAAIAPTKLDPETLILSTAGKYESRKGHPELIDACIEIGKEKPIVLVSFVFNPFIHDNFPYGFINSRFMYPVHTKSGIKVFRKGKFLLILMPPTKEKQELHAALSKADFFVSPSKGEGWNLPLFEMMSYGMPCITTLNTAHTDYCTTDNCIEVHPDKEHELIVANDGQFFHGDSNWYNITIDSLKQAIEDALEAKKQKEFLSEMGKRATQATSGFSWQKSAKMIVNLMKQN
mgnify:CR=1 FL=1|tara:strand:- start:190648 stop:191811 length:1164 start_codon:yes stop_codon:yes gene_type:complete